MEREDIDFHDRVRRAFTVMAAAEPGRFEQLDGSAPFEDVLAAAMKHIHVRLETQTREH
jgi:thymidylate kinase